MQPYIPVSSELYFSVFTGDQLRYERQVWDLRGGPAKLEYDDEWNEIDDSGVLRGQRATAHTLVEDEGKGKHHAHRPWIGHAHKNNVHVEIVETGIGKNLTIRYVRAAQ